MRLYSIKEIVYEKDEVFSGLKYSFEEVAVSKEKTSESDDALNDLQTQLNSKEQNMRDNLNTIFKIFGLKKEQHLFQTKRQYLFNDDEKEFFWTLLDNFGKKSVWKKGLKKLQPVHGAFMKLYKSGKVADRELVEEIEFVVEGLLGWFNRLHEDPKKREDIKRHLYNVTSINSIKWAVRSKKILVENLALLEEDTGSFAFPVLMTEYENYMGNLTTDLERFMRDKKNIWEKAQERISNYYGERGECVKKDEKYGEYVTKFLEAVDKRTLELLKGKKIKEGEEEQIKDQAEEQAWLETIEKFGKDDPEKFNEEIGKYLWAAGQL